jgi:hypothetical protein
MEIRIETPNSIAKQIVSETQYAITVQDDPKDPEGGESHYVVRKGTIDVFVKNASASVHVIENLALDVTPGVYIPNSRNATDEELDIVRETNRIPVLEKIADSD